MTSCTAYRSARTAPINAGSGCDSWEVFWTMVMKMLRRGSVRQESGAVALGTGLAHLVRQAPKEYGAEPE
jgi:hypothetical protein